MTDSTGPHTPAAGSQDSTPTVPLPSVLHVLPHPGGGGETYVDTLGRMDGFRFERRFIASDPSVRRPTRLLASMFRVNRDARAYDLLHVHGEVAALLCLPALARRPSLLTLHGLNLLRRSTGIRRRLAVLSLRLIVAASDRTICVSEGERDEVLSAVGASLASRVVLIRNGVALPDESGASDTRRDVRAELGTTESAVVAVCVGELTPLKDPLTVAAAALAAAREHDLMLCFAGDGPLRGELESLVAREGGGSLRVLGQRTDVDRLYAASDVIVIASQREGLPYTVLEGMSWGLAPIVSDVAGCIDAAGDAAIVVRRGDVAGFAAALERLAVDSGERSARGARARDRVARLFRATEMVDRTRLLYDEAGGAARRGASRR